MEKRVSAADANRKFSQLLRGVRQGRSYLVTAHGKPVAKIVPATEDSHAGTAARKSLFSRLRSQQVMKAGRWSREELYDE